MKKLVIALLVVLATTNVLNAQQVMGIRQYDEGPITEKEQQEMYCSSINKAMKKFNLIPENMQEKELHFSDSNVMRKAKISAIYVTKAMTGRSLQITILFEKTRNSGFEKMRQINITERSVMNEGSKFGFKLIDSEDEYDEEIYILFEDETSNTWFKTLLEGFSGKSLPKRFDPKD